MPGAVLSASPHSGLKPKDEVEARGGFLKSLRGVDFGNARVREFICF
jgi:hypothetical protein